ncbi:hypothetical protein ACPUYX_13100 [Desulfosporosinus sp. SYSU MS00001]
MFWGGIRKIVILSIVTLAALLDKLFGNSGQVMDFPKHKLKINHKHNG